VQCLRRASGSLARDSKGFLGQDNQVNPVINHSESPYGWLEEILEKPRGASPAGASRRTQNQSTAQTSLLDLTNFQQYQARQRFSFLKGTSGTITTGAKYTVKVPETNIYYLLVDNQRAAVFPRIVNVYSYAVVPEATADSAKAQQGMEAFYQRLRQLFVFQDFRISIRYCGFVNAFSESD